MASDPYVKLYCTVLTDAKFFRVKSDGFTMYVKGLAYSGQYLTDGFVPTDALALVGAGMKDPAKVAQSLVDANLWTPVDGGFTVGEERWADRQTTRQSVDAKREQTRERVRRHRSVTTAVTQGVTRYKSVSNGDVTLPENRKQKTEIEGANTGYEFVDGEPSPAHDSPRFWEALLSETGQIPDHDLTEQAENLIHHWGGMGWQTLKGVSVLTDPRRTAENWARSYVNRRANGRFKPEPEPQRITVAGLKVAEE